MGSAPTILHGQERNKSEELVAIQTEAAPITKTPADPAPNETEMATTARKLTFSTSIGISKPTLAAVVQEVEKQKRRWRTSLIGYVIGGSPQFKEMLKFVYRVWQFVSTPQEPDFQMCKESTKNVPVWVNFSGLPIQYWTTENLGRIASSIGNPIHTDKLTAQEARVSYARMLIEMDVSHALPETVLIETAEGNTREQKLSYDWHPSFCQECLTIGHDIGECNGQTEMEKYKGPDAKGQIGGHNKRGKRVTTKWIVKQKTTEEAQAKEVREETSKEEPIAPPITNTEIEQQDNGFQIAKSKGKQVQSPKERSSMRKGMTDETTKAILQKNRFNALRIQEREDASLASKEETVPLAHPP
ncbi:PREDICTED: uncharacterized protein LOC109212018 [Nicotiana attenuata]|uniref:uncharacterized protein LOC109212018 n=1 Tax=Nicotiana attenuata TaxID=49451 RepID=UPI000905D54F|nr:PREDICTED: uncharacterized protein LOC109212018 [Nicotiana attenuata]